MVGDTASSKARLRKHLRRLRRAISAANRRRAALRAARHAARLLRKHQHIASSFSCSGELDTAPLMRLLARRHRLYLPRLTGNTMRFVRYRPGAALKRNRFGIAEPLHTPRAARLNAIVLPLVGFDAQGRRLGQGGGYYDRALPKRRRAYRLGYAYSLQEIGQVPVEPHDAPLDAVVTERGIRKFR